MSTEAQIKANQANAQRSTGPKTEEGKAKARFNARRHGLTGQFYVMNDDDRLAYQEHEAKTLQAWAPAGYIEEELVIAIAQDQWRLHRSKGIEFNAIGLGHNELSPNVNADAPETEAAVTQATTWVQENKAFANMALYENRVFRMIEKNRKELKEIQALRKAAESKAREEAELVLSYKLMRSEAISDTIQVNGAEPSGLIPTPAGLPETIQVNGAEPSGLIPTPAGLPDTIQVNGFVFSTPELIASIDHKQTLEKARWYKSLAWDGTRYYPHGSVPLPKAA